MFLNYININQTVVDFHHLDLNYLKNHLSFVETVEDSSFVSTLALLLAAFQFVEEVEFEKAVMVLMDVGVAMIAAASWGSQKVATDKMKMEGSVLSEMAVAVAVAVVPTADEFALVVPVVVLGTWRLDLDKKELLVPFAAVLFHLVHTLERAAFLRVPFRSTLVLVPFAPCGRDFLLGL